MNKENYGLYIERTENVNFYNNIVYGTPNTKLYSNGYNSSVNIGNNCWYQISGSKPSVDTTGIFADPMFINSDLTINGDYRLLTESPCINRGTNADSDRVGEYDLNGNNRINGIIEIGAFEDMGLIVSSLKLKENGSWVNVLRVYKKENGSWVEQNSATWGSLFNENTKYMKGQM